MSSTPDDSDTRAQESDVTDSDAAELDSPVPDTPEAEQTETESQDQEPQDAKPDAPEPEEPETEETEPEETEPGAPTESSEPTESTEPTVSSEPVTPASRLRTLMGSPGRSQVIVGVLLAVLGFAAVTQVRSTGLDDSYQGRREEELIEIFNGLTGTADRTRREIARLEQRRRELQVSTSARSAAIEQAEQRLRTLNILAGTVPVTGPGLRITVTEEGDRVSIDSLLDLVQELRTAGGEAMEFNDEVRLVASSSFSDVNGVIHLDGVPLTSPYVLEVIGESYTLRTAASFPSGPVTKLRDKEDADVAMEELDAVDIESVRDLPRPEFAEPAEGQ